MFAALFAAFPTRQLPSPRRRECQNREQQRRVAHFDPEPKQKLDMMRRNVEWFDKYLGEVGGPRK